MPATIRSAVEPEATLAIATQAFSRVGFAWEPFDDMWVFAGIKPSSDITPRNITPLRGRFAAASLSAGRITTMSMKSH